MPELRHPDTAEAHIGAMGDYWALAYFAHDSAPRQLEMAEVCMGKYSNKVESPSAVFGELSGRLARKYELAKPLRAEQFAGFTILRNCFRNALHSDHGGVLERAANYAVVRHSDDVVQQIKPQPSNGPHIDDRGISSAQRLNEVIGTHNLIHLPISEDESKKYTQIFQVIKAAVLIDDILQPFVAHHITPAGKDSLEQQLFVEELQ